MNTATLHHFKRFRAQGYTAEAALLSARSHLHFVATLRDMNAKHKRRSVAAKKAWKVRRATA